MITNSHDNLYTDKILRKDNHNLEDILTQLVQPLEDKNDYWKTDVTRLGSTIVIGETKWEVVGNEFSHNYLMLKEFPSTLDVDYYTCKFSEVQSRLDAFDAYLQTQMTSNEYNALWSVEGKKVWLPSLTNVWDSNTLSKYDKTYPWGTAASLHFNMFPTYSTGNDTVLGMQYIANNRSRPYWINTVVNRDNENIYFYVNNHAKVERETNQEYIDGSVEDDYEYVLKCMIRPCIWMYSDQFGRFKPTFKIQEHVHNIHQILYGSTNLGSKLKSLDEDKISFYTSSSITSKEVDLNTFESIGQFYKYTGNTSNFTSITNGPSDLTVSQLRTWSNGFTLFVIAPSAGMSGLLMQILIVPQACIFYLRYSTSSSNTRTWNNWKKFSDNSYFESKISSLESRIAALEG